MAIQNDSTLLCKGDLKAYHESIAPYLGGNLMVTTNVSDYYSEDEKVVGVWIDGKPIYKRSFTIEVPSGTSKTDFTQVNLSTTSNPEVIVDSNITIDYFNNNSSTPHWKDSTPQEDEAFIFINPNLIGLNYRVQSQLHINIYATAYYTKTTDTASSALTTPGCYDINRPDTWPANQEIFFGSGLYGARVTGSNVTIAADGQLDRETSSIATKIINCGGAFSIDEGLSEVCVPCGYASAFSSGFWINNNGKLLYWIKNERTSSVTALYDAWVLYKK